MDKHNQLEELLVDWEQRRRQGNELTVEQLCKNTPELVSELSKLIDDFKATDWLEEDDASDDDFLHLPDFSTVSGHADETRLPECKLSLDEFCQRLVDSCLMDEEQVRQLRQRISADNARAFAQQLVSDKKLTRFQATVLLEGRDIPLVLDRYVLLGEIGKGGMGAVYKALHQQLDRVVALKILPKESVDSPEKVKRFQREAKAAAKLEHANIVTTHDASDDKGYHFLVMSLVSGSDLAEVVRKQGPLSAARAVDYIAQAARGLEHAHSMGIVHRDIKPANLLLSQKGKIKILDMGLARIENGDPEHDKTVSMELTQAGMVMGTIAYLAPEQALDTRTADARSDIYSLGCTLHYLLTGKNLYTEDTMMKTIMAHREDAIPSLCDEREGVPEELDAVFQKMVAKKSEDRFQSMTEVISALEGLDIKDEEGTQPVVADSPAYHETATFIDTSRDVIEAQPSPQGSSAGSGKRKLLIFTAAAAFILLAGIIYRIQTNKGMITVELADKSIAAKLTTSGVIIEDGDRKWTVNIGDSDKLPAGETYSARLPKDSGLILTVTDDSGTELDTRKFQIRRNGKVLVKVTAVAPVIAATETQTGTSSKSGQNWALEFDGVDDYVEVPGLLENHRPNGENPITIEIGVWPKRQANRFNEILNFGPLSLQEQAHRFRWLCYQGGDAPMIIASDTKKYIFDGKVTLCGVFDGRMIQFFVDGKQLPTAEAYSNNVNLGSFNDLVVPSQQIPPGTPFCIGKHATQDRYFSGIIDEVRISNVARYTKDYTPTNLLEADKHTLALYHFDEGQGDVLKDSSGNGHHGKIHGAKWVKVDDELKVIGENQSAKEPTTYTWPIDHPLPAIAPFSPEEAKQHQEAWAKHLGVPVEMENSIGMKFRVIPPGEFLMGTSEGGIAQISEKMLSREPDSWQDELIQAEGPQHRVILSKPYAIGMTEVTVGQFRIFVEASGYRTEAEVDGTGGHGNKAGKWMQSKEFLWDSDVGFEQSEDHPVVNVSWNDAMAFIKWISEREGITYRLPTEAEWECACRTGTKNVSPVVDEPDELREHAHFGVLNGTSVVAKKRANSFGLHDMLGNVWEWCTDGFLPYESEVAIDPVSIANLRSRVLRGGSHVNDSFFVRPAVRLYQPSSHRNYYYGFRIVRTFEKYEPKEPEADGPSVAPKPVESSKLESSETGESDDKLESDQSLKSDETLKEE